jgi:hypothetical protein
MPLSQNARVGLVVGGVAAALFVVCAGGVVALVVAQRDKGTGTTAAGKGGEGKPLAERPVSEGNPGDDESYILGHRWWKRKPTKDDLERIVRFVTDTPSGRVVCVSNELDLSATIDAAAPGENFVVGKLSEKEWGTKWRLKPYFSIDMPKSKRPQRGDVLRVLRSELDRVEYRDGPSR